MSKYGCIYLGSQIVSKPAEGTVNITSNGTLDVSGFDEAIVSVSSGNEDDVNFYDYDGTLLYSYSAADFANLSSLPSGPSHTGLTFQSWNWSLSDAKTYVSNNKGLDIGANYSTDNGATRIYITIDDPNTEFRVSWIQTPSGSATTTINWGDNSAVTTDSRNSNTTDIYADHTYAQPGDYVISMTVSGTMTTFYLCFSNGLENFNSEALHQYKKALRKVELGGNVTCVGGYMNAFNLESISIPTSASSDYTPSLHINTTGIGSNFQGCSKLKTVVIPSTMTAISSNVNVSGGRFQDCTSLKHVLLPLMVTCTGFNYIISGCSSIERIYFTGTSTVANYGCRNCPSLKKVVIPYKSGAVFQGSNIFQTDLTNSEFTYTTWTTPVCIYCYNPTPPGMTASGFGNANYFKGTICVPSSAVNTYKGATNWSTYSSRIVAVGNEPLAH